MLAKTLLVGIFAANAAAQSTVLGFTSVPNPVTDGQPQAITYQTNDTMTPVTIVLRQGISTDLNTIYNLTTTAIGGSYIWTPRTDLPNGNDYALQIIQGDQVNYYGPFRVQGYTGSASSSSLATSSVSASDASMTTPPPVVGGSNGTASGTGSYYARNTTFVSATLSSLAVLSSSVPKSASLTMSGFQSTAVPTSSPSSGANAEYNVGSLAVFGLMAVAFL